MNGTDDDDDDDVHHREACAIAVHVEAIVRCVRKMKLTPEGEQEIMANVIVALMTEWMRGGDNAPHH
jgi:hypothetical protein